MTTLDLPGPGPGPAPDVGPDHRRWRTVLARPGVVIMLVCVVAALVLAVPGQTVTNKYVNDLFIFLDGVWRIDQGQVPNRDFHTALGPLVYYIPAIGRWIGGSFTSAMPIGMGLLLLAMAPVIAHVLASRLRPALAIPLGVFLVLVVAVPINLGEDIRELSFAMFYNRVGWAALALLLMLYVQPRQPAGDGGASARLLILDTASATFLTVLMLYIKISYAAVALGFLCLLLIDRRHRLWAAATLAATMLVAMAVEAVWGGTASHLLDLMLVGQVSGNIDDVGKYARLLGDNLADIVVFAAAVMLSLWRTRSLRDLVFFAVCLAGGMMLLAQNFQARGIVTLAAAIVAAAELAWRVPATHRRARPTWTLAAIQLLVPAILLPPIVFNGAALGIHAGLAVSGQGDGVPLPQFQGIRMVAARDGWLQSIFDRYRTSIADGRDILDDLGVATGPAADGGGRVVVLDFVNPFTAGIGLVPPHGDSTWHHWGRTIDDRHYLPAATLFRDARVVMEPKAPIERGTAEGMRRIYDDTLTRQFRLVRETSEWRVFMRRSSMPGGPPVPSPWPSSPASPDLPLILAAR